jgi:hypothetical protein
VPGVFSGADDERLGARLAARTLELIDIPSESRQEAALHAHLLGVLRDGGVSVRDAGDTCLIAELPGPPDAPVVVLAGHLDTVPAQGNRPGRIDGDAVIGLGASDMLGAVALMTEAALHAGDAPLRASVLVVLFGREELPVAESSLTPLLGREPLLRGADLALVMEPTDNAVQAGCLGNINARWSFHGVSAHSARPWQGDNAIERAAAGIARLAAATDSVHGGTGDVTPLGVAPGKGFFVGPVVRSTKDPMGCAPLNEHEVFGPVTTVAPYNGDAAFAAAFIARGEGCLVSSAYSDDRDWVANFVTAAAPWAGRLYLGSSKMASQSPGPGTVLPSLLHGGPGRAGGGEELGGERGLYLYMQRTALEGDASVLKSLLG